MGPCKETLGALLGGLKLIENIQKRNGVVSFTTAYSVREDESILTNSCRQPSVSDVLLRGEATVLVGGMDYDY